MKAVIIGAGIGGMTAAISLRRAGIEAHVYERATRLEAVGAGLAVAPNCSRVLQAVGLGEVLEQKGVRPERLESADWKTGDVMSTHELNEQPPKYGVPYYSLHRADLVDGLAAELHEDVVRFGRRAIGVIQDATSATVHFDDGSSASADLVVGADGIKSGIRQSLFGPDASTYSGCVAYRAVVRSEDVAHLELPNAPKKWWGPTPEHHFVHYFISAGVLVNMLGVVPEEDWREESWTVKGDVADFKAAFADYAAPIPDLVDVVTETYKWALYHRPPLAHWGSGRVTLLGDAAHPMVPFLGQGAAMAIEDAAILARCLDGVGPEDVADALHVYEITRMERTSQTQARSRSDDQESWSKRDWVYGYDALTTPLSIPDAVPIDNGKKVATHADSKAHKVVG